jgi:signal transduction histidine kinase
VDVRAHAAEGHMEIEVIDTGRGISAEFMPRMFERFGRADRGATNGSDRGLGLGLAIARELVELHGGTLTAASAGLDKGATFIVTLPYLTARGHATGRRTTGHRDTGRHAAGRGTAPTAVPRNQGSSTRRW